VPQNDSLCLHVNTWKGHHLKTPDIHIAVEAVFQHLDYDALDVRGIDERQDYY
jgi:hypothetical protein